MREALRRAIEALGFPPVEVALQQPRDPGHGDLATNVALKLGAELKRPAREVAEQIATRVQLSPGVVEKVEVAGPGFINFWLATETLTYVLPRILEAGEKWGRSNRGGGKLLNVEYVSANPTGPLHVGHGRGAALGDAIASLLEATGYEVTREFYVNDAGVQVDRLARSLWARVQQGVGRAAKIPEDGYHGNYLVDLARELLAAEGPEFADLPEDEGVRRCREIAVRRQREEQDRDLADFGVRFDVVYWESQLYGSGLVDDVLRRLKERDSTYERDGALWLRTSDFGDAKDRVLRKRDGSYTYFVPDIAYHVSKAERGFERAIDVWGADHHGYVPRMAAALAALGYPPDFFQAVIVQLVRVMRHGEEVRFSKRSGQFVTLRDLYEETGVDAARYFFLMRRADSQFVFDIDLATKQSEENPVYYVQYAHTRMAGIFRTAGIDPRTITAEGATLALLTEPEEQELVKTLGQFPEVVFKAAEMLEPHRIVAYLEEVARLVNRWYHRHRVLGAGADLEQARLVLARASQIVLANGLRLIGVTAPERM